jgi:biopolymer transport protein ExbB/TolQ
LRGGVFLWPIGLLSVAALYLIIERAIYFLQSRPSPRLQRALTEFLGGAAPTGLEETLGASIAPEATLARVGLDAEGADAGDAHRRLERALLE